MLFVKKVLAAFLILSSKVMTVSSNLMTQSPFLMTEKFNRQIGTGIDETGFSVLADWKARETVYGKLKQNS